MAIVHPTLHYFVLPSIKPFPEAHIGNTFLYSSFIAIEQLYTQKHSWWLRIWVGLVRLRRYISLQEPKVGKSEVEVMFFPLVSFWCFSGTIKKAHCNQSIKVVLSKISHYQKSTHLLIPNLLFSKLVHNLLEDHKNDDSNLSQGIVNWSQTSSFLPFTRLLRQAYWD